MLSILIWMLLAGILETNCSHLNHDAEGRVMMGEANPICDDGKSYLERDINCDDFICRSGIIKAASLPSVKQSCPHHKYKMDHKCMDEKIHYNQAIPNSGPHRPLWPRYGEYFYVPPQRWLHSVEHGAAVFLFHPCLDPIQIDALREIATTMKAKRKHLHKYIITPYNLPREMPIAVVTYKCILQTNAVVEHQMRTFVEKNALRGPESINKDGQYSWGLKNTKQFVQDKEEIEMTCLNRRQYWF